MIIGLTGGIASGKSTVANYLSQKGFLVIDADQVVRQMQEPGGSLYQVLVYHLGQDILSEDGHLDRAKIGQLFFSDPDLRAWSDREQGGLIRQELAKRRNQAASQERHFFMDIPLLFEQDYQAWFDQVWLLSLDEDKQLERLMKRNHFSLEEAQARLASQMPLAEKIGRASHLLDNNGDLALLLKQIDDYIEREGLLEKEDSASL